MRTTSILRGIAVASVGVLSLMGCDSLRIDQGVVNTDEPAAFKCDSDEDCLTGYRCLKAVGSAHSVCTAVGAGLNCEQFNLDGDLYLSLDPVPPEACFGLRGDCDDEDPNTYPGAPELCDGKDNSCNGLIDDGLDAMPCPKQLGVCQGASTACVDGAVESCDEPFSVSGDAAQSIYERHSELYSEVELCDGVDNNCDGVIDEGCCDASLPLTGVGAGANQGCNCSQGQVFACGTETGTCTRGVRICHASDQRAAELPCYEVKSVPAADLEECDPEQYVWEEGDTRVCVTERVSIFEDLDDETCASPDAVGCTRSVWRELVDVDASASCGSDADCDGGGNEVCALDGICRPVNVVPTAEMCNGLDDNCDGSVDNHYGSASGSPCGDCPFNTVRVEARSQPTTSSPANHYCVDVYEASRPDATADNAGSETSHAVSQRDVLPWTNVTALDAHQACGAFELREKLDLPAQHISRVRMVPTKTLCEPHIWAQACAGQRYEGNNQTSLPMYPFPFDSEEDVLSGFCNVTGGAGGLLPTSTMVDCWKKNAAFPDANFDDCVDSPNGNCRVNPVDMIGNAMEWTANVGAFNGQNVDAARVILMGASYAETGGMTCRENSGLRGNANFPSVGTLVRTDRGVSNCGSDADCPGASVCGARAGGMTNICYLPCTNDSDCSRGSCNTSWELGGSAGMACTHPPMASEDWADYDDVGFRCCANPLGL